MRIRALLYTNSMPFTLHLCLLVAYALLLFLCSITSCLAGRYQDCSFPCGGFHIKYPLGIFGSGYQDLKLVCDMRGYHHPLLNISGNEYRILGYMESEINDYQKQMTIVNNNLFGDKCNLSGNYSQFWSSDSHFKVLDSDDTNLTLWKQCDQIFVHGDGEFNACGDQWFYSFNLPLNWKAPRCDVFQLPVVRPLDDLDGIDIKALLERGFNVTWHVDPNRARICDACFKSNGRCGYNISNPTKFLCYCPNNTSHPSECPGRGIVPQHTFNVNNTNHRNKIAIIVGSSFGGFALIAIILVLLLVCYLKKKKPQGIPGYQVSYLEQHSMRIPTLQLILTVYICLLAFALLCSSITCLRTPYDVCKGVRKCGRLELSYPFGHKNTGCGDPDFQLDDCDHQDHFPLLNISGDQYRILEAPLDTTSGRNSITIINDKLWGGKCNLSGNYNQFWLSGSHFQISNITYTNITLWRHCDEKQVGSSQKLRLCDDEWYYLSKQEFGTRFCVSHIQVPIKKLLVENQQIEYPHPQNHQNFSADLRHINGSVVQNKQNFSVEPQHINRSALQINQTFLGQGFEITWNVDTNRYLSCGACLKSNGSCGYNITKPTKFLCYCPNNTSHPSECPGRGIVPQHTFNVNNTNHRNKIAIIVGYSIGGAALVAIAAVLFLRFYAKKSIKKQPSPPPRTSISKVEKFLREYAYEMPTRDSYSQLKKITNNYAEKLGEGGFGVVYKGKLRNGALVAVKLLDRHRQGQTQFMNEVATIGRVHHVNLVRLLGYCFQSHTSAVVYEYMVNGSLEKFLFAGKEKGQDLSWEQLYSIALGAARGIAYLHQDCEKRIIHFDIKPHNILLDSEFTPKISDFGLAKLCGKGDDHISVTGARGTPGYVAPEVWSNDVGPVTDKSDVYSFGMFLLEIVGGRKNIDVQVSRSSQLYFPEWAFKLLESGELGMRLRGGGEMEVEDEEKARRLTKIGLWCIQYNYRDRPCMSRVVQMLEGNGDDVSSPPLPFNSSAEPENPVVSSVVTSSTEIEIIRL